MDPNKIRSKIALYFFFFLSISLIGLIIYQSKTKSKDEIAIDAYKEALRLRDSTLVADRKISQDKQALLLKRADSLQDALNEKYKKDSVIFYNYEKNKPRYSGYSPAKRNAALDSLLRSRK